MQMNTYTDDWRGDHLIRAPKNLPSVRPHKRAPEADRLERRRIVAMSPNLDAIAARLAIHAAAGLTQSQAAAAEGVTRSWVSEIGQFRRIAFTSHRPKRRKEGSV